MNCNKVHAVWCLTAAAACNGGSHRGVHKHVQAMYDPHSPPGIPPEGGPIGMGRGGPPKLPTGLGPPEAGPPNPAGGGGGPDMGPWVASPGGAYHEANC